MIRQFTYLYGTHYEPAIGRILSEQEKQTCDIIIYTNPIEEHARTIGSLEGFFISACTLTSKGSPLVRREQMPHFEEKYHGKFIPFKKSE